LAPAVIAGALLVTPSTALASGGYPGVVAGKLGVAAPACTLCHDNPSGGAGTATRPFAVTMKSKYDLTGGEADDVLEKALDANKDDSDTDGTSDVDELKAGSDPNQAGGGNVVPAKYGCFEQSSTIAGVGSRAPRTASLTMAGLVAVGLLLRRRR
jgi:hypothetical protein